MISVQPTPAEIEKVFLKTNLTPLFQSEASNYISTNVLQNEAVSNTVSAYSSLNDEDTEHLFLVVSETDYIFAPTSTTVPQGLHIPALFIFPITPIVVVPSSRTDTTTRFTSSLTSIVKITDIAIAATAAATSDTVVASIAETTKLAYKNISMIKTAI